MSDQCSASSCACFSATASMSGRLSQGSDTSEADIEVNQTEPPSQISHTTLRGRDVHTTSRPPSRSHASDVDNVVSGMTRLHLHRTRVIQLETEPSSTRLGPRPYQSYAPHTAEEILVQSMGYEYTDTRTLQPGQALGVHGHHSTNIHYVVTGLMEIWAVGGSWAMPSRRDWARGRLITRQRRIIGPGEVAIAGPNVCYTARVVGGEPLIFVEGHSQLSPVTRQRFESALVNKVPPPEPST